MSSNRKFGSNVPVRRGRTASSSSQKTNNHSNKKDKINAQRVAAEKEEDKELYFTEDYGELESMVPQLIQDEVAGAKTTKKYEALMNSVLSQEKRAVHHQLLAEHHGQSNNDKTRQNGCLVRPQRILSQKRFHSSIDRNNMKNNTNALFQQQEKLLTTIVNNQSQNKKNSSNNNNNDDDDSPAGASAVSKMMKKMMDSAYGHGTNGIRVVNGKLKTLVVSWLGALEGSHLGHLLRSEYFGTLNTNNGNASASSVLAEPASRRALCCVAVRYNKGYADWASSSASSHSASHQQQTVAPPPSSAFFENLTPFQVVGCLSMDEPILELTFPDGDDEGCAGVGTEVAVFYTPGLNLGIKNTNIYANNSNNNNNNNTKQDVAVATTASSSSATKAKITGFQEVINPLLTANGELRCSLCVELTYTSVDVASNPKRLQTLKVQEASLIPHDDNNWIPLRSWVAHQIIQRKRKQLQEKEQEKQNENEEEVTIPSSALKKNHNSDAAVSSDVEAKKSSSLPHHHQQQQRLTSPLFGAMKTTNNLAAKMTSRTKEERDGRGVPSSGLDYDSDDDDDDVDSGVDDDDDDDDDVVDLKKFKLTNSKPGTDETS